MNPTPYVMFADGKCREAMAFYAELFGGEIEMMMPVSEAPIEMAAPDPNWIMHGAIQFDEGMLMGCDDVMGRFDPMMGSSISMMFDNVARGRSVFDALAQGGEVSMPFDATFFSPGFGTVRDRYGINWMIMCDEPA